MAEKPHFVYGQRADDRSRGRMLFGLIIVEQFGYRQKKYRPDWRRLSVAAPLAAIVLLVLSSEAYLCKEKYSNGVATATRADMCL